MKRFVAMVCLLAICISLVGCNADKNALVGKWYLEDYDVLYATFYSDGTCELRGEYGTCQWDIVDGQLKIVNVYKQTYASDYELNGDTLVINGWTLYKK